LRKCGCLAASTVRKAARELVFQAKLRTSTVSLLDARGFVCSKGRGQHVGNVFSTKPTVTSPQKQKAQRGRRGFFSFRWWPGAESTRA